MRDLTPAEVVELYDRERCPMCRSSDLRAVASGGMSLNVWCGGCWCGGCGAGFNLMGVLRAGQLIAEPHLHRVVLEALCEMCGTWHSVKLVHGSGEAPTPATVRPVCWCCGHRPVAIVSGTP